MTFLNFWGKYGKVSECFRVNWVFSLSSFFYLFIYLFIFFLINKRILRHYLKDAQVDLDLRSLNAIRAHHYML